MLNSKYSLVFAVRATLLCNGVLGPFTSDSWTPPLAVGNIKSAEDILSLVWLEGLLTV